MAAAAFPGRSPGFHFVMAIKSLYIHIPMALYIIGTVILYFANVDKIYPEIKKDLDARKQMAANPA